jgi:hypothetical protein
MKIELVDLKGNLQYLTLNELKDVFSGLRDCDWTENTKYGVPESSLDNISLLINRFWKNHIEMQELDPEKELIETMENCQSSEEFYIRIQALVVEEYLTYLDSLIKKNGVDK